MAQLRRPDEFGNTEDYQGYDPLGNDYGAPAPTPNPVLPEAPPYQSSGGELNLPGGSNFNEGSRPPTPPVVVGGGGGGDTSGYEARFKASLGNLYDPTIMQDFVRNTSNNGGGNPEDWFKRITAKNQLRANNEVNSTYTPNGQGGFMTGPAKAPVNYYSDPGMAGRASTNTTASGSSSSNGGPTGNANAPDIMSVLRGLFPGGGFNNDVYTKRVSNASDTINRFKRSQLASDKAALAERGLLGSGPENTAYGRLGENVAGAFGNAVTGIEADEAARADDRMMKALELATGMTESQAANAIAQYNAETNRTGTMGQLSLGQGRLGLDTELGRGNLALGQGNLALGNLQAGNAQTLGLGNLALGNTQAGNTFRLGSATLANNAENQKMQHIIDLMAQGLTLEQIRAMGYI